MEDPNFIFGAVGAVVVIGIVVTVSMLIIRYVCLYTYDDQMDIFWYKSKSNPTNKVGELLLCICLLLLKGGGVHNHEQVSQIKTKLFDSKSLL